MLHHQPINNDPSLFENTLQIAYLTKVYLHLFNSSNLTVSMLGVGGGGGSCIGGIRTCRVICNTHHIPYM